MYCSQSCLINLFVATDFDLMRKFPNKMVESCIANIRTRMSAVLEMVRFQNNLNYVNI